jgi:conjugal transfer pilus assembly protein TraV
MSAQHLGRRGRSACDSVVASCLPLLLAALSGCSNMSGLGGSSEMTCAAPPGVPCQSVSGVHANASTGNLPSQRPATSVPAEPGGDTGSGFFATTAPRKAQLLVSDGEGPTAAPGPALGAIRSEPTLIRIWIAPWEDSDGDLHSDSYVYLQVDSGRWLVEHNRERIRRQFAPMPAPVSATAAASASATPAAAKPGQAPAPAASAYRANGGTQR